MFSVSFNNKLFEMQYLIWNNFKIIWKANEWKIYFSIVSFIYLTARCTKLALLRQCQRYTLLLGKIRRNNWTTNIVRTELTLLTTAQVKWCEMSISLILQRACSPADFSRQRCVFDCVMLTLFGKWRLLYTLRAWPVAYIYLLKFSMFSMKIVA